MSAISASFRGLSQQSHLLRGWSFTEGASASTEDVVVRWGDVVEVSSTYRPDREQEFERTPSLHRFMAERARFQVKVVNGDTELRCKLVPRGFGDPNEDNADRGIDGQTLLRVLAAFAPDPYIDSSRAVVKRTVNGKLVNIPFEISDSSSLLKLSPDGAITTAAYAPDGHDIDLEASDTIVLSRLPDNDPGVRAKRLEAIWLRWPNGDLEPTFEVSSRANIEAARLLDFLVLVLWQNRVSSEIDLNHIRVQRLGRDGSADTGSDNVVPLIDLLATDEGKAKLKAFSLKPGDIVVTKTTDAQERRYSENLLRRMIALGQKKIVIKKDGKIWREAIMVPMPILPRWNGNRFVDAPPALPGLRYDFTGIFASSIGESDRSQFPWHEELALTIDEEHENFGFYRNGIKLLHTVDHDIILQDGDELRLN
jgi:hypothetical protein